MRQGVVDETAVYRTHDPEYGGLAMAETIVQLGVSDCNRKTARRKPIMKILDVVSGPTSGGTHT